MSLTEDGSVTAEQGEHRDVSQTPYLTSEGGQEMRPRSQLRPEELLREVGSVLRMSEAEVAALPGQPVDPSDDQTMIINMGPQHPSTHGVLRLMLELQGETVLLQLDSGEYFGLDPVSTRIWQLIVETGDLAAVEAAMLLEFDVERAVLEKDLARIVDDLVTRQLIELDEPAS